jgi:hypothetical protein
VSDASFLPATRNSYDATVAEYVKVVDGLLEARPLARSLLGAFAELVRAGSDKPSGC